MLPLRLLVNISWIWEVAGVVLGVLGGRFGFDLELNIEIITEPLEFRNLCSRLHGSMVFQWFVDAFRMVFDGLGMIFHALGGL